MDAQLIQNNKKLLRTIEDRIMNDYGGIVNSILVYGSRIMDYYTEDSDVDIMVFTRVPVEIKPQGIFKLKFLEKKMNKFAAKRFYKRNPELKGDSRVSFEPVYKCYKIEGIDVSVLFGSENYLEKEVNGECIGEYFFLQAAKASKRIIFFKFKDGGAST